jgi:peptidoglycan hydrolase-like protein with peptidoglycan-binding domain
MTPPPLTFRASRRRRGRRYGIAALVALPFVALVVLAVLVVTSKPSVTIGRDGLASVNLPFGGGTVKRVLAFAGRGAEGQAIPVRLQGDQMIPTQPVKTGERITVVADVARPGWISWLAGSQQQVKLSVTTPRARLRSPYVIVARGRPLTLHFTTGVSQLSYGASAGSLKPVALRRANRIVRVPVSAPAGTLELTMAPRSWEKAETTYVSWFPPGASATVVASPTPGTRITPQTPLKLTFSRPVSKALSGAMPPVSPSGSGSWRTLDEHTIEFVPSGYGYGLGAHVSVGLPAGINVVGGTVSGSDPSVNYSVPAGSTLRLQQMLALLGYLPLNFTYSGATAEGSLSAEEQAAVSPPAGRFSWRYPNTPAPLQALWAPGQAGEMTTGAVMAFENSQGIASDGVAGPAVWKALINALLKGQKNTFGYTYVHVSEGSPETEYTWHDGKTVESGPVNTGIAAAPTATGVFAVFEHLPVTTMSGVNPDGTTYHDPGIQWVSYFNGGDALHEYPRGSYGFPQSLGCVEMPMGEAAAVYPYTPIGTIVNVVG